MFIRLNQKRRKTFDIEGTTQGMEGIATVFLYISLYFFMISFIFLGQKGRRAIRPVTEGGEGEKVTGWCAHAWILSPFTFFASSIILFYS